MVSPALSRLSRSPPQLPVAWDHSVQGFPPNHSAGSSAAGSAGVGSVRVRGPRGCPGSVVGPVSRVSASEAAAVAPVSGWNWALAEFGRARSPTANPETRIRRRASGMFDFMKPLSLGAGPRKNDPPNEVAIGVSCAALGRGGRFYRTGCESVSFIPAGRASSAGFSGAGAGVDPAQ